MIETMKAKYLLLCLFSVFFFLNAKAADDTSREVKWKYIGRSFGGDDVFFDEDNVSRNNEANAIRTVILVNKQNCSENDLGATSDTSEEHRKSCVNSFKYASSVEGVVFWCGDSPHSNEVETQFGFRFDHFDGKGKPIAKFSGDPVVSLIEPDRPSRKARDWLCKSIH